MILVDMKREAELRKEEQRIEKATELNNRLEQLKASYIKKDAEYMRLTDKLRMAAPDEKVKIKDDIKRVTSQLEDIIKNIKKTDKEFCKYASPRIKRDIAFSKACALRSYSRGVEDGREHGSFDQFIEKDRHKDVYGIV